MTDIEIKERIAQGESSTLQFKLKWSDNNSIAKEFVAFANSRGGTIVFGVEDKTGKIVGLTYDEVQQISQSAANMAENNVVPNLYIESEPVDVDGKTLLLVNIPSGLSKPYKTLSGDILVKQGADKRVVKENSELLRMFYDSGLYYPDVQGVKDTSIDNLNEFYLNRFFQNQFGKTKESFGIPLPKLYQNLRIMTKKGELTLAGLLFFGTMPQFICPQFVVKAVAFVGNDIFGKTYRDSRDLEGTLPEIFDQAMQFCEGNLRHAQAGQSFNSIGKLVVSRIALEELIQNALVHREYLGQDVVKLLIFDNRVEIISPGCLPKNMTVDDVMMGNAAIRNPQMSLFCSKTMAYRGLGSGILRAINDGAKIELHNDVEHDKFVAVIWIDEEAKREFTENEGKFIEKGDEFIETPQKFIEKFGIKEDEFGEKFGINLAKFGENLAKFGINLMEFGEKFGINAVKFGEKSSEFGEKAYKFGEKPSEFGVKSIALITLLMINPSLSAKIMGEIFGVSTRAMEKSMSKLKSAGIIRRVGPDRGGEWVVITEKDK